MKILNTIHLNGLRAVEAVGRHGNLSAAAEELGVTPGAISQQILKVEKQLGRAFFERTARGLEHTVLGAKALPHLTSGMRGLAAGAAMMREADDDRLILSVPPVFAAKWLVWRLGRFHDAHPDITVRVDATMKLVDMPTSDVDLCIRISNREWPGLKGTHLLRQRIFPVCSPAMAQQLKSPHDIRRLTVVRDRLSMFDWNLWFEEGEPRDADLRDGPTFSDASLCLDATIAGQGIFLAWDTVASDALAAGSLVAPFERKVATDFTYTLLERPGGSKGRAIKQFKAWLMDELRQSLGDPLP
jgi:LysR family glycine cleavage system transcriptional activator